MSKRRWLILLFSFLLLLPILLIGSVIVWVSTESQFVLPEPLPDYPSGHSIQGLDFKNLYLGGYYCDHDVLQRDSNRAFATKDSKEQVGTYYKAWVDNQKLESSVLDSIFNKGQSNYCFIKYSGMFATRTAVGFVYLSYSEKESAGMIQKLAPNLDRETNVIIFLRGPIIET